MEKNELLSQNAFDIVGLIATFSILIGHTVGHAGLSIRSEIYKFFSPFFAPGEALALTFAISGFVVAASWERDNQLLKFYVRRIFKIYPHLFLVIIIPSIIYLWGGYVDWKSEPATAYFRYFIRKFIFTTGDDIVPEGAKGNVSLWTIVIQMQFYILTPMLVGFLKKRRIQWGFILILISVTYNMLVPDFEISNIYMEMLWYCLCFPYIYMYLIGVVCYVYHDKIVPILRKYCWTLLTLYMILQCIVKLDSLYDWYYINPFSGSLICFIGIGISYRIKGKRLKVDPSYGIYLWHMPILEGLHYICRIDYSIRMVICVWLLSVIMGIIQFRFIEKPCQILCKYLNQKLLLQGKVKTI